MSIATQDTSPPTPAWKSPWVIGWVVGVLIVLSVNLVMVYLAITTSPGLVVKDYYDRGQDYEKTLLSRMARDPGWQMSLDLPARLEQGRATAVGLTLKDRDGVPVRAERVTLHAYRPADARQDFAVPLGDVGSGLYWGEVHFPLKGVWDILVSVRQGQDEYHQGQRIQVSASSTP